MELGRGADPHEDFLRRLTPAQPVIRRFVLGHVGDFHKAEDVLQEVTVVLWKKFPEFVPGESFERWAFGIARHKILRAWRDSERDRLVLSDTLADRFAEKLASLAPQHDQRRACLRSCLEKLPERSRTVIEMRYSLGSPLDAIAAGLGSTVNAVRILLCRSRRLLARCMGQSLRGEEMTWDPTAP